MSDRCTEGCGLAQFPKGHPETTEGDKLWMRDSMIMRGFQYAEGFGYHAIADLFDRSHGELRELLVQNFPARFT